LLDVIFSNRTNSAHGSYEVTPIPDDMMFRVLRGVSHWVYLSAKNLQHLVDLPISKEYVSAISNGMPIDERPFEFSRPDLGIAESDFVFVIASRAIPEKGWEIAIRALELAQLATDLRLHLVLCGSGPEFDRLAPKYQDNSQIHFLGFQERIPGAYRMGDVALLPTRFPGESYPLSLIQAMQAGRPVIATDIGEIVNMLKKGEACAGVLLPFLDDDDGFVRATADAMLDMTNKKKRTAYAADALKIGSEYSITNVAKHYSELFEQLTLRRMHRTSVM
jgi:glycosyltransferase involved in cell wall biosynthesis